MFDNDDSSARVMTGCKVKLSGWVSTSGSGQVAISRRELLTPCAITASSQPIASHSPAPASHSASHVVRRAKSVILIWLDGGPSALETFDPRPDAPLGLRGPHGAIRTSVPGFAIGTMMPRMAALMDRVTLVRTVTHSENLHHRACRALLTIPVSTDSQNGSPVSLEA